MGNVALPGGFVDTGITGGSSTSKVSAQLRGFGFGGGYGEGCNFYAFDHEYSAYHGYDYGDDGMFDPTIIGYFYLSGPCNVNGVDEYGYPIPIATVAGGEGEAEPAESPVVTIQQEIGPFRLGMRWKLADGINPSSTIPPHFAQNHYVVEYHWFADYDTKIKWTCNYGDPGTAEVRLLEYPYGMGGSVSPDMTPVDMGHVVGGGSVGARVPYQSHDHYYNWGWAVKISDFIVDGHAVDFSGITRENSDGVMENVGGVLVCKDYGYYNSTTDEWSARGPYGNPDHSYSYGHGVGGKFEWTYDIDVQAWGNSGGFRVAPEVLDVWLTNLAYDSNNNVLSPYEESMPVPYTRTFTALNYKSWEDGQKLFGGWISFQLKSPDPLAEVLDLPAEIQDPNDPENPEATIPNPKLYEDLKLPIRISPPRLGVGSGQYYQPATLSIAEQIELDRPDGNRPSSWVSTETECTVTEESDRTEFVVAAGGTVSDHTVSRTLATNWRNYVDNSGGSVDQPDFSIEGYRVLRHHAKGPSQIVYPEDVWWWGTYRYLRVDIDAPVTGDLILQADYVTVDVYDDHMTGLDRKLNLTVTETPGSKSWTLPVEAGRHTYEIDLLFPDEGGPVYLGRIEKLTLFGLQAPAADTHTYTLHGMQLFLKRRDGQFNSMIKLGFGIPKHRRDYSAPVISIQGSWTMGNLPDKEVKGEETGEHGGSFRYWEPLTGRVTGTNLDWGYNVPAFWGQLGLLEGITAVYDVDVENAANKDGTVDGPLDEYGNPTSTGPNSLGPLIAQCSWEIAPYESFEQDNTYKPKVSPVCGNVTIPSSIPVTILARMHLWSGVEAVVTNGEGTAAEPGVGLDLVRLDSGEIVVGATTDDDGYVVFHPVLANGEKTFGVGG